MKSLIWAISMFLLTAVAGVLVFVFWPRSLPVETYQPATSNQPSTVEYCELKSNPQNYDGKIIRLRAKLGWFMHGYFLADENCSAGFDESRTAILFLDSQNDELWQRFKSFHDAGKPWQPVRIVAIGRFSYKNEIGGSDHIRDRTHLQFEIHSLESAVR